MDPDVVHVERAENKTVREVVISSSGITFTLRRVDGKVRVVSRTTFRRTTFIPRHEYVALIKKAHAIFDEAL